VGAMVDACHKHNKKKKSFLSSFFIGSSVSKRYLNN